MRTVFGYVGIVTFALLLLATTLSIVKGHDGGCTSPSLLSDVLAILVMALGLTVSVLLVARKSDHRNM